MKVLLQEWKAEKLWGALSISWLLTVVFAFENGGFISIEIPYAGAIMGFRVFMLITVCLFAARAIRTKQKIWHNASTIERWAYVFIAVMLIYGAASLPRAISFERTIKMLFNLCFDMAFFFLAIQLCKEQKLRRATLRVSAICVFIIAALGVYEVFFGGIVNPKYNALKRFLFFGSVFQFPVVFNGNTNDYSATLIFSVSVLLISSWFWNQKGSRFNRWAIALLAVDFFLLRASSARLCIAAYWILIAGLIVSTFFLNGRTRRQAAALLVAIGCICFCNQYRYIVPPVQNYISQWKAYRESGGEMPTLVFDAPAQESLKDQFFSEDEKGTVVLNETGSAGVRAHLLIHCWNCLKDSYGLGVGLGNTGQLAIVNKVSPLPSGKGYYESIHCFVARVIADYGVFALIPMCAIAYLFILGIFRMLIQSVRKKERAAVAFSVLALSVMLTYPLLSTASSDAQDSKAMWLYLAMLVLLCNQFKEQNNAIIVDANNVDAHFLDLPSMKL